MNTFSNQSRWLAVACALIAISAVATTTLAGCDTPTGAPAGDTGDPGGQTPGGAPLVAISIDFDSPVPGYTGDAFLASGTMTEPGAGYLDADAWAFTGLSDGDLPFGQEGTTGDFARGESVGGVSTGGIYAFLVEDDNRALGVQPTASDFAPGSIGLRIPLDGAVPSSITLGYTIYSRNDQDRATAWTLATSFDGTSWAQIPLADHATPEASSGSPSWEATPFSFTLTPNDVDPSATDALYLLWTATDGTGTGGRDESALDDITVEIR